MQIISFTFEYVANSFTTFMLYTLAVICDDILSMTFLFRKFVLLNALFNGILNGSENSLWQAIQHLTSQL